MYQKEAATSKKNLIKCLQALQEPLERPLAAGLGYIGLNDAYGQKKPIVSGLRARHFNTSASMVFLIKKIYKKNKIKFPLFFSYKRVSKTLSNVTILYPKTCVTDNMSDSL